MATVAAIVSIAAILFSTGISVNQLIVSKKNQDLRNAISAIVREISSEVSKGRLKLTKLISLLQSKNQSALMTYLQNNPVISRNIAGIQHDSDLIASIQAEQNSLESDIAQLQAELSALGYSQSGSGLKAESEHKDRLYNQLNAKKNKYNQLVDQASKVELSTTNPINYYTGDIDARSQNINGGLK